MSRTYVAIVRDHSGSMGSLVKGAINDYNLNLNQLKAANDTGGIFLTVIEFEYVARIVEPLQSVALAQPITKYRAGGATALWDAVGLAATTLSKIQTTNELERAARAGTTVPPDSDDAYLVMVITDGEENVSKSYSVKRIMDVIRSLQNTDKWSFVFRVPVGYAKRLASMGIYPGNISEWDQTEEALAQSTKKTEIAIQTFFNERKAGKTSTKTFFANLDHVAAEELDINMDDVTDTVQVGDVGTDSIIKDFCVEKFGQFKKGHVYYQLTKSETVQDYKEMAIRNKTNGKVYKGLAARSMLGLPILGAIRVKPGNYGDYELFVQSTSVNRKLLGGTRVLYVN